MDFSSGRKEGKMIASMEFDMSLYNAIKEAALARIDVLSQGDLIINRAWAKDMITRMG